MKQLVSVFAMYFLVTTSAFAKIQISITGYSKPSYMKKLVEGFNRSQEGIEARYVQDKVGHVDAVLRGEVAPAHDVLLIRDASYLWKTVEHGVFQSLEASKVLAQNIPAHLRDKNHKWFMMTKRARVLYYHPDKVKPHEIDAYEKLGDPKFKNKVCLRTSRKYYNKTLVSFFFEAMGHEKTERLLKSWMKNEPIIKSTDMNGVIKGIHDGDCWVGLANTYYFGHFLKKHPGSPVRMVLPRRGPMHAHINGKFFGVAANSKRPEAATRFLEYFSSVEGQRAVTDSSFEFPVNPGAPVAKLYQDFMPLVENKEFDYEQATIHELRALKLMLDLGWI